MSEGTDHDVTASGARTPAAPWRRGLLQTLRERLEQKTYHVPSEAVAASIIDRAVTRGDDAAR